MRHYVLQIELAPYPDSQRTIGYTLETRVKGSIDVSRCAPPGRLVIKFSPALLVAELLVHGSCGAQAERFAFAM